LCYDFAGVPKEWGDLMSKREITFVTIAGVNIPAALVVCPECKTLDLNTDFNTSLRPWVAMCSSGHQWFIEYKANA
jgi:hypothetical protein